MKAILVVISYFVLFSLSILLVMFLNQKSIGTFIVLLALLVYAALVMLFGNVLAARIKKDK